MSRAFLFSGQGSQYVGMGLDFLESDRDWFDSVEEQLDFDLEELLRNGPGETLERTLYTQPAIFVVNHLIFRYLRDQNLEAGVYAGHSLGELNALVAAGWASFEDMLPVVVERGRAMDEAAREAEGGMLALLKADREDLENLCRDISDNQDIRGTVEVALLNNPIQFVASGSDQALEVLEDRARDVGALKAVPLDVSGPWHSQYMAPAQEPLREKLNDVDWSVGDTVYQNVTAQPVDTVQQVEKGLTQQLTKPVRWFESVQLMEEDGVENYVEVGPGDVVKGMVERSLQGDEATVRATDEPENIHSWLEA